MNLDQTESYKLHIWLWLSSYGIMFAILTFLHEIYIFPKQHPIYLKGLIAIILGSLLFYLIPYHLEIKDNHIEYKE